MAKHHLADPLDAARTRCGYPVASPAWKGDALPIAATVDEATCCNCLRALRDAIAAGDELEPFERKPAHEPVYGARDLDRAGRGAIDRVQRGEALAGRGWPSPEAAVRAYVRARAEGAALRSTSDPDRANRVQLTRGTPLGGREHAVVEQHRTTALALDRAAAEEEALAHVCPLLAPTRCGDVYVLRIVGRMKRPNTRLGGRELKGTYIDWAIMLGADVVAHVKEYDAIEITEHHVSLIVRHFSARVRDALMESGEASATCRSEFDTRAERDRARRWDPARRLREAAGG